MRLKRNAIPHGILLILFDTPPVECIMDTPPVECILEGLKLCLTCNNSIFNNRNVLQTDGTAQEPHMSCSYSDV